MFLFLRVNMPMIRSSDVSNKRLSPRELGSRKQEKTCERTKIIFVEKERERERSAFA